MEDLYNSNLTYDTTDEETFPLLGLDGTTNLREYRLAGRQ